MMKGNRIVIDCTAFPFVPEGWSVIEHKSFGEVGIKDGKLEGRKLLTAPCQSCLMPPVCTEIEAEITQDNVPTLNANVLDYLLAHKDAVPASMLKWHKKDEMEEELGYNTCIWFWGTKYKNEEGERCLRGLCLENGELREGTVRIDRDGLLGDPMILHDWFNPPEMKSPSST
jgi:hypothetical protein